MPLKLNYSFSDSNKNDTNRRGKEEPHIQQQIDKEHKVIGRQQSAKLQKNLSLIYMSLNKNYSVYCVKPRSWKPHVTCKWGGPKWQGILQLLPAINIEESSKNIGAKQLNMLLSMNAIFKNFCKTTKEWR